MSPPSNGAPRAGTMSLAMYAHGYHPGGRGVDQPRKISTSPSAMINRLAAHTDQATQAAVRRLIPPTPRCSSLAPCVTAPLYSTTVSQGLRNALRGSLYAARRERTSENSVMAKVVVEFYFHEPRRCRSELHTSRD